MPISTLAYERRNAELIYESSTWPDIEGCKRIVWAEPKFAEHGDRRLLAPEIFRAWSPHDNG
jgi:hypothetical protein